MSLTPTHRPSRSAQEQHPPPTSQSPQRATTIVLWGLAALALFYTLYFARALFIPIVLALVLNLLLSPLVRWLNRAAHVPRGVSSAVIVAAVVGLFAAMMVVVTPAATAWFDEIPAFLHHAEYKLRDLIQPLEQFKQASRNVEEAVGGDSDAVRVTIARPTIADAILSATGEFVLGLFTTVVLLYFLLCDGERLMQQIIDLFPHWRDKRHVREAAMGLQRGISRYLMTITAINIGLGAVIGAGMWLAGLPNPALWGVMAAALNFVPYLGATVGTCIVAFVGLTSLDDTGRALIPPLIYIGANAIEANFVTPALLGRRIRLNPVVVMLSLLIWTWMWGILGAVLAVPILIILKITQEHLPDTGPASRFLGR